MPQASKRAVSWCLWLIEDVECPGERRLDDVECYDLQSKCDLLRNVYLSILHTSTRLKIPQRPAMQSDKHSKSVEKQGH